MDNLVKTNKNYKIIIPFEKVLKKENLEEIKEISKAPYYTQKLNRLRLDKYWMQLIEAGEVVYIEFEDWINKTLSRYHLRIGCESRKDIEEHEWPMIFAPGLSIEEALVYLIPWANFEVDEEAYKDFMQELWDAEYFFTHDKETGIIHYTMPFEEWYEPPEGLQPCSDNGETQGYRLILHLNTIGESFLILDDFLQEEEFF